jgi:hypothetical protein
MHERFNESGLSIKLFEFLLERPKSEPDDAIIFLYGELNENNISAFRKLLERFRDRMYESHCLDINIYNKEVASEYFAGIMETKKMLAIITGVVARGVTLKEEVRLCNKGINIAKKFEQFDELIILLKLKLIRVGFNFGFYKQSKILEEIEIARKNSAYLFESRMLFLYYITDLQIKSYDDSTIKDEIKKAALRCKELYELTGFHNIFSNWYMLEIQYSHYNFDYASGLKIQIELLDYILKQPCLYQFGRIADNYLNLSRTQTYLFMFKEAIKSVNNSIKFTLNNVESENFYKEDKVFILIYMKEYDEASSILKLILSNNDLAYIANQFSRRKYLFAIVYFLKGDYKLSFKELQETNEIEDDRSGWNIGVRMLQIYLTLETEKIDLADKKIENLRKHIERTVKMKSIRKRDVVIFRLLTHLSRCGFDFKEVWEERQKDFKLLRSDDPDYRWIPRSHELILFDQWFESKVKNQPYEPVFPEPQHS